MRRISLTAPIWSNAAYLFVWFAPVALELQVLISLLGIASALFHAGELKHKVTDNGALKPYSQWSKTYYDSFGYIAQRVDMILIYAVFIGIGSLAMGWYQVGLFLLVSALVADLLGFAHRFFLVGLSAIFAIIALIVAGAWLWVGTGLGVLVLALMIRQDAYTYPIRTNNGWHSLWHVVSSQGLILMAIGAS